MIYAIVGHPNAGKTTLFNTLTGKSATVGNWHGVTVEKEQSTFSYNGQTHNLIDLPGIYSLACACSEERVTQDFLINNDYQGVIFVVEAKKVKRAEKLIFELKKLNKKVVVFVNGYDQFKKDGGKIDFNKMQTSLQVEVVLGNAFDKNSAFKLLQILQLHSIGLPIKNGNETNKDEEYFFPPKRKIKFQDLFLNKFVALPVFVASMVFTFWFCFGKFSPISLISVAISRLFDDFIIKLLSFAVKDVISPFLYGLIFDGIFKGVISVLEFLPQVCALSLCMNFLNQSGFFSRFSAVADDFLSKFGLSGRALYALVCGFGCTAVALTSVNGISDEKIKRRVALSLPIVSCSAKTPVYAFLAKGLFGNRAFLVISAIYFSSIVLPLVNSYFLKKTFIKGETENYVSEIADMRIPAFKPLLKSLQKTAIQFIIKVGTVILISSALVWILKSISFDFKLLSNDEIENSMLCLIGKRLAFLFHPIGILNWEYAVGAVVGLFAKEGVVSTLSLLGAGVLPLSFQSKIAFIVFCYAYTPCVTALGSFKREFGVKFMLICAIYWLIGGFLLSYLTYFILNL
ncbi:MAG: ferrous iron transporter B [Clostridia bacterium]|nr:ferrous iron transporter B [Clostridia bacterium]